MTNEKSSTDRNLCGCGCGVAVKNGNLFLRYHANRLRRGIANPNWNGGQHIDRRGYVWITLPSHPHAMKNGVIRRSHVVAEQVIGRVLRADEAVHHVNRIRSDDRPENLRVMTHGEHTALHWAEDARVVCKGEAQGQSKLTEAVVAELRRLQRDGRIMRKCGAHGEYSILHLAKKYGVDRRTIRRALDGHTWK